MAGVGGSCLRVVRLLPRLRLRLVPWHVLRGEISLRSMMRTVSRFQAAISASKCFLYKLIRRSVWPGEGIGEMRKDRKWLTTEAELAVQKLEHVKTIFWKDKDGKYWFTGRDTGGGVRPIRQSKGL